MANEKAKTVPEIEPFARLSPVEAARNKRNRDARRIAIREQNRKSKVK